MAAWSYSALSSFETCPKKHYLTRIAKQVKETEGEAARWGKRVHKAFEDRVLKGTPLPTGLTQWEPMMRKLEGSEGEILAETQFALDANHKQVAWFDKSVWVRAVIDFGVIKGDRAVLLDYKTGKPKPDSDQLKLFAAVVMAIRPEVNKVSTGYLWLNTKEIYSEEFTREELPELWKPFLPRVQRLDYAFERNDWPARPSGLCRRHCPCTGCEFNGQAG